MVDSKIPTDAPPSYDAATGSSSTQPNASSSSSRPGASSGQSHLDVPGRKDSSMPAAYRRSMEDETRPLPAGWVRSYDPSNEHQFYVDTKKDPPRSIWTHPYDDDEYLSTLNSEERERIEQESMRRGDPMSKEDIAAAHTDDEEDEEPAGKYDELPPRTEGKGKGTDTRSFGRKFKDKVTGMTHEEREVQRKQRAQQEREMWQAHLRMRRAMSAAMQTGQPQYVGKDRDGKDLYVEPPGFQGGYGGNYRGFNPYRGGVYTTPDARYIRPPLDPYGGRPYGRGYGGGLGLPIGLGLGGGLLLGGALGGMGGFGGGGM